MQHRKTSLISVFLTLIVIIVYGLYRYGPKFNVYLFPPSAEEYGKTAIDKIDRNGIYTNRKRWQLAKKRALDQINKKQNYQQIIPILNTALKIAGGKHSFVNIQTQQDKINQFHSNPPLIKYTNFLYIHEPEFTGSIKQGNAYANKVNEALQKNRPSKIILDLRDNTGGDMGPMIGGISALIPNGKIFSFVGKSGKVTPIRLFGSMINAGSSMVKVQRPQKLLHRKIAVIINKGTASSGELTALSLQGLPNVKFFGSPTAGYTSVNQTYTLFDGRQINLTTSGIRTRNGNYFLNDKIIPQQYSTHPLKSAQDWLSN
ncbi:S41 family peptidase [Liquorilactobacillus capillatus]|uniref:Nisin resistance protein family protein n=1 Tax=Liquorilactobacillus capillatus DSM 19910 TaxID=1423731 RepID=A0A0R1MBB8_9LACO|nr:S41 family peptidase [Liquorilactobacillus capillatus]KRL02402.1 nisin resistance protein family protein [Liquorilactobacillus capillatus DSM 19910]